ncbi:MAG: permease [Rhodospirillales bacterium]|jgi:uncharacterized membrane protein YraQ (UPF0718 family)
MAEASLARAVFDVSFWVIAAMASVAGVACWVLFGPETVVETLGTDVELILFLLPKLAAAFLIAAFVQVLLPRDRIGDWIGERSGVRGIALASVAGAVTPGGPMTSFPVVTALHAAGTGRSALVAYLTAWSTLGLQRILTWEVPLMGVEFAALRFVVSLPLPFVAGLVVRLVPIPIDPPGQGDR